MDETLYDALGGADFFVRLVDAFYERVALDEVLRPMYPEDLTESRRHLALFLAQYWGGPPTYQRSAGILVCGCATRRFASPSRRATPGSRL